ncbi:A24 family peptidase [Streptomonospora litoralis]|uniref:Type IV leader peptidase family protein n=1 Tax=Streptomonospora litoralis TaxID=2498135 RepID=A0A4P6Q3M6_9ACTN|nr:A24 family peptidase [Streptomonospora litoralis]QBI53871.1 Type IV leader peptidase family protein [Streptomonospora litoralis]
MLGIADAALALLLAAAGAPVGAAAGRLVPLFARHDPGPDDDAPPPPPACPACGAPIPFVGWLPAVRLRGFARNGRCPACARSVPPSAPLAAATGVLFGAVGLSAGVSGAAADPVWTAALLFFAAVGALLAAVDVRVHRLPDAIVGPAYPIAVPLVCGAAVLESAAGTPAPALSAADLGAAAYPLGGLAGLAAFYWLLWFIHPAGMGWGDVKIAGLVGLYLGAAGFAAAVAGTLAAFLASAVYGVVLLALRRATRRTQIPFGPFMIGGALAVLLAGPHAGLPGLAG